MNIEEFLDQIIAGYLGSILRDRARTDGEPYSTLTWRDG